MPNVLNRIVKSIAPKAIFDDIKDLMGTNSFAQGDLMIFDTSTNYVRKVAAGDTGLVLQNFIGISRKSVTSGVVTQPYSTDTSANTAASSVAGPVYGVEAALVLKTGDALTRGAMVYPNVSAGAYHVTATAGSLSAIGVYNGPSIASASTGQLVNIHIGCRYPNDTLKF